MKKYENWDNFKEREHLLEVTLQSWEHKWVFSQKVSWNAFWNNILTFFSDFDDFEKWDETNFLSNDVNISFSEDEDWEMWFKCYLKNENGEICEVEDEVKRLKDLVVKLEIVDCKVL